jgi:N-methylhydantoinase A/oxoprolinase/acetone carboxylase beta subunit
MKLDASRRREVADGVASGRKSGAEMARLYNVSQPTVSRIVAELRERCERWFAEAGIRPDARRVALSADMRYTGQN